MDLKVQIPCPETLSRFVLKEVPLSVFDPASHQLDLRRLECPGELAQGACLYHLFLLIASLTRILFYDMT